MRIDTLACPSCLSSPLTNHLTTTGLRPTTNQPRPSTSRNITLSNPKANRYLLKYIESNGSLPYRAQTIDRASHTIPLHLFRHKYQDRQIAPRKMSTHSKNRKRYDLAGHIHAHTPLIHSGIRIGIPPSLFERPPPSAVSTPTLPGLIEEPHTHTLPCCFNDVPENPSTVRVAFETVEKVFHQRRMTITYLVRMIHFPGPRERTGHRRHQLKRLTITHHKARRTRTWT